MKTNKEMRTYFDEVVRLANECMPFAGTEVHNFFALNSLFGYLLRNCMPSGKYSFTLQNKGGSWISFICPAHWKEAENEPGFYYVPCEGREADKVTILLHWGMKSEFLEDLTSWGHERCPYKVDEVPYAIVEMLKNTQVSNYWDLYDMVVSYKETGQWKEIWPEYE